MRIAEAEWIRADGAFTGIVPAELFNRAREIILARDGRRTDDEMLAQLAQILATQGYLSGLIIDEAEECPSSSSYSHRFGSLLRAYALVGFVPDRDYRYLEINRALRRMHPQFTTQIIEGVRQAGGDVRQSSENDLLTVNEEFTVSVVIVRCIQTASGSLRWKVRLDSDLKPDLTIVVRMAAGNAEPKDFYLLPLLDMQEAVLRLCEFNELSFDAYRVETLTRFFNLTCRRSLSEVA
jgi:hypothetical protein